MYPQGESKRQGNFMGLNMLLLFKANNFVTLLVSRGLKHGYYIWFLCFTSEPYAKFKK